VGSHSDHCRGYRRGLPKRGHAKPLQRLHFSDLLTRLMSPCAAFYADTRLPIFPPVRKVSVNRYNSDSMAYFFRYS
jgi:hypothetical protein